MNNKDTAFLLERGKEDSHSGCVSWLVATIRQQKPWSSGFLYLFSFCGNNFSSCWLFFLERNRFVHKYIFHSRVQINLYMHCNMIYGDGKCIFVQEIANAYIYLYSIHTSNPRPWGPVGVASRVEAKLFTFFLRNAAVSWYVWCCVIRHLSPVPEHAGTGLCPLIPVPGWFRRLHFFHSGTGLTGCRSERTDWMPGSPQFGFKKNSFIGWHLAQKLHVQRIAQEGEV